MLKGKFEKYCVELTLQKMGSVENKNGFEMHEGWATVNFDLGGSEYKVHVPFEKSQIRKSCGCQVFLVDSNGEKVEITQKPGCIYTMTAAEMGGKYFIMYKRGKSVQVPENEKINFEII